MNLRAIVLCAAAVACTRELSISEPQAVEVRGLTVAPPVAKAGDQVKISFSLTTTPKADPVVTVGGVVATKASGPDAARGYLYGYVASGAEPEGRDVVVSAAAGGPAATGTVRFDFTPPALAAAPAPSAAVIAKGQTLSVELRASEPLGSASAELQGRPLDCAVEVPDRWTCKYVADGTEREGPQQLSLTLADAVGNVARISAPSGASFDFHAGRPPSFSGLTASPARARAGTAITIAFSADRELSGAPSVTVAAGAAQKIAGPDALFAYVYQYAVTGSEPEGAAAIQLQGTDLVGRAGSASGQVALDFTPPTAAVSASPAAVKAGAVETVSVAASEALLAVSASAGSKPLACAPAADAAHWSCALTAAGDEAQGPADVALALTDLAGNVGALLAPAAFAFDFVCVFDPSRLHLARATAAGPVFSADAGAFEPHSSVGLYAAASGGSPLASTTAAADGSVAAATLSADLSGVWARAFDPAGNACTAARAKETYSATFAARAAGQPAGSVLRAGTIGAPTPPLAEAQSMSEVSQSGYAAALSADASRVPASAAAASSAPAWNLAESGVPAPTFTQAMTYDSTRARSVRVGGNYTWEYDGSRWVRRLPTTSPPDFYQLALAYDSGRKVSVLGGAPFMTNTTGQLWEWDGTAWTQRPPTFASTSSSQSWGMAYDPVRALAVLTTTPPNATYEWNGSTLQQKASIWGGASLVWDAVNGKVFDLGALWSGTAWSAVSASAPVSPDCLASDTTRQRVIDYGEGQLWEWNGSAWAESSITPPPSRPGCAMAFDSARGKTVLFGGGYTNETWEWDGAAWTQPPPQAPFAQSLTPSLSGFAYWNGAAAFDSTRSLTVGLDKSGTWTWNGSAWTLTSATSPARAGSMAFDSRRGKAVFFAGADSTGTPLAETWEWDGAAWAQIATATSPLPRVSASMTFDSDRGRVVLFGGLQYSDWPSTLYNLLDDTWEYDGVNWTRIHASVRPPPLTSASMSYDAARHLTVLFGQASGGTPATWIWDGSTWTQADPGQSPFFLSSTAYDDARRRIVGIGDLGGKTWEWDGVNWNPGAGAGPPEGDVAAIYDGVRRRAVAVGGLGAGANETWELTSPYSWPAAFATFDLSAVPLEPLGSLQLTFVVAGHGAGDGADAPGALLFLWDYSRGSWADAGSNLAADTDSAAARTITFAAAGADIPRWLEGGVLRALAVPAHGASSLGAAALSLDAVALDLSE